MQRGIVRGSLGDAILIYSVYLTMNFSVLPAMVMKYIPAGKDSILICCVSAVILPERMVCPMRLVMQYSFWSC